MIADALAIVRTFENPTYFITMTTDHQWSEILSKLLLDQNASSGLDVLVRVHHPKQRQLTTAVCDILSDFPKFTVWMLLSSKDRTASPSLSFKSIQGASYA